MTFNQALYDAHIDAMKARERIKWNVQMLWCGTASDVGFTRAEQIQARNANRLAAYKRKRAAYNCGAAIRNTWLKAVRAYKRKRLAL